MIWGFLFVGLWFVLIAALIGGAGPINAYDPHPDDDPPWADIPDEEY